MMRRKSKIIFNLILTLLVILSCQNKRKQKKHDNINTKLQIELIKDLNFDKHLDTLKVIKNESSHDLVIKLFGYQSLLISKKLFIPKGLLYSGDINNYINVSYEKNTIIVTQEYGSSSLDGWYICYHKNSKKIFVDSIRNNWKNFEAKSDNDFILSKIKLLKIDLENFDGELEYNKL